jgi:succinate-semialdehyde dehydrogenase/glutarate-semialdehyde dehydrogenase
MTTYRALQLYIGGRWIDAEGRTTQPVLNPATEKTLGDLPHASSADLDAALDAAKEGFAVWRRTSPYERGIVLKRAAALIRQNADRIATYMTLEQGKTIKESRGEVGNAADMIEWFAEEGRRAYGRIIAPRDQGRRMMVLEEPVGPVAAFAAWNVPAQTMARKVGAALAAGCSVILKPAEETPATPLAIAELFEQAGLPPGVLNVVFGVPDKVSRHLLGSEIIKKVTFTGSIPVGKHLATLAAAGMKRITMELGGHAPAIIFNDVDVDQVASGAVGAKFRNAGQICVSPSRFLVHDQVYDKFVTAFAKRAAALKVGDGMDAANDMGPCANARRLSAMAEFVADAKQRGGTIAAGGKRIGNAGYFFEPTLITDVPDDSMAMTVEPFGPLAVARRFSTFEEAVGIANSLPYGLAAYAFSDSARTILDVTDALETGMLAVNNWIVSVPESPFGGVKESGYGSEGGIEGLEAFLTTKFVHQAGSVRAGEVGYAQAKTAPAAAPKT